MQYTIEEAKQKAEQDALMAEAEAKKLSEYHESIQLVGFCGSRMGGGPPSKGRTRSL
jgi:hypothetical protein